MWVGGYIHGQTWLWLNGQPIYFGWAKDEPNNDDEDCVHFYSVKNYYLNDFTCTRENPFICEIPGMGLSIC